MTGEQIASLQAELAKFLEIYRPYFRREKTFGYLLKYLLGLMADLKRKSIEPIALAAGLPVRTLQEFLSFFEWDHDRIDDAMQRMIADRYASPEALGILDASGHPKQGDKTPGVQHQYCGERGKQENCVVGQHLLYTDNDPANPFSCVLGSDLYVPESWIEDRPRCRQAGIPDELVFRTKWQIGLDQIRRAIGNGVRFSYIVFDADYGRIPHFWFGLDAMGQRGVGGVGPDFNCWTILPHWQSGRAEHSSRKVKDLATYSPVFTQQPWRTVKVKEMTRGHSTWRMKAARVHLVAQNSSGTRKPATPTDRKYWLIVADNLHTNERKYLISNAGEDADPVELLRIGLGRWHVEKWFERAKQEAGLGDFEVRTYVSLIRHWLCSRLAMFFLSSQTKRLRGEKSADHGRTSGNGGQRPDVETLETVPELVDQTNRLLRISPVAQ
jgi:SRSO17 transposase